MVEQYVVRLEEELRLMDEDFWRKFKPDASFYSPASYSPRGRRGSGAFTGDYVEEEPPGPMGVRQEKGPKDEEEEGVPAMEDAEAFARRLLNLDTSMVFEGGPPSMKEEREMNEEEIEEEGEWREGNYHREKTDSDEVGRTQGKQPQKEAIQDHLRRGEDPRGVGVKRNHHHHRKEESLSPLQGPKMEAGGGGSAIYVDRSLEEDGKKVDATGRADDGDGGDKRPDGKETASGRSTREGSVGLRHGKKRKEADHGGDEQHDGEIVFFGMYDDFKESISMQDGGQAEEEEEEESRQASHGGGQPLDSKDIPLSRFDHDKGGVAVQDGDHDDKDEEQRGEHDRLGGGEHRRDSSQVPLSQYGDGDGVAMQEGDQDERDEEDRSEAYGRGGLELDNEDTPLFHNDGMGGVAMQEGDKPEVEEESTKASDGGGQDLDIEVVSYDDGDIVGLDGDDQEEEEHRRRDSQYGSEEQLESKKVSLSAFDDEGGVAMQNDDEVEEEEEDKRSMAYDRGGDQLTEMQEADLEEGDEKEEEEEEERRGDYRLEDEHLASRKVSLPLSDEEGGLALQDGDQDVKEQKEEKTKEAQHRGSQGLDIEVVRYDNDEDAVALEEGDQEQEEEEEEMREDYFRDDEPLDGIEIPLSEKDEEGVVAMQEGDLDDDYEEDEEEEERSEAYRRGESHFDSKVISKGRYDADGVVGLDDGDQDYEDEKEDQTGEDFHRGRRQPARGKTSRYRYDADDMAASYLEDGDYDEDEEEWVEEYDYGEEPLGSEEELGYRYDDDVGGLAMYESDHGEEEDEEEQERSEAYHLESKDTPLSRYDNEGGSAVQDGNADDEYVEEELGDDYQHGDEQVEDQEKSKKYRYDADGMVTLDDGDDRDDTYEEGEEGSEDYYHDDQPLDREEVPLSQYDDEVGVATQEGYQDEEERGENYEHGDQFLDEEELPLSGYGADEKIALENGGGDEEAGSEEYRRGDQQLEEEEMLLSGYDADDAVVKLEGREEQNGEEDYHHEDEDLNVDEDGMKAAIPEDKEAYNRIDQPVASVLQGEEEEGGVAAAMDNGDEDDFDGGDRHPEEEAQYKHHTDKLEVTVQDGEGGGRALAADDHDHDSKDHHYEEELLPYHDQLEMLDEPDDYTDAAKHSVDDEVASVQLQEGPLEEQEEVDDTNEDALPEMEDEWEEDKMVITEAEAEGEGEDGAPQMESKPKVEMSPQLRGWFKNAVENHAREKSLRSSSATGREGMVVGVSRDIDEDIVAADTAEEGPVQEEAEAPSSSWEDDLEIEEGSFEGVDYATEDPSDVEGNLFSFDADSFASPSDEQEAMADDLAARSGHGSARGVVPILWDDDDDDVDEVESVTSTTAVAGSLSGDAFPDVEEDQLENFTSTAAADGSISGDEVSLQDDEASLDQAEEVTTVRQQGQALAEDDEEEDASSGEVRMS